MQSSSFWDIVARAGGIGFCIMIAMMLIFLFFVILAGEVRANRKEELNEDSFFNDIERFQNDFD